MKMSERLKQYWATKQANLTGDVIGNVLWTGPFTDVLGQSHAILDRSHPKNDFKGLLPGVGASRVMRRQMKVRKDTGPKDSYPEQRIMGDDLSWFTPVLLFATLGFGGGLLAKDRQGPLKGAGIGAGVAVSGALAGLLTATLTKRRTKEEQAKAERQPAYLSHIVPGLGMYNKYKRLGYSANYDNPKGK